MGPMTGRAAGYCAGYGVPGYANPIPGRGFGYGGFGRGGGWGGGFGRGGGRGGGRGWRNGFYATGQPGWARAAAGMPAWGAPGFGMGVPPVPAYTPGYAAPTPEQEIEALKAQAEHFEGVTRSLRDRITEIEGEGKDA